MMDVFKFWEFCISLILSFILTSGYILFEFYKKKIKVGKYGTVIIWKIALGIFFILLGIFWLSAIIYNILSKGKYSYLLALIMPIGLLAIGLPLLGDRLLGRKRSIFE